ncbi:MAG: hypothetical protein M3Q27_11945 [Actinomycetota bacterium]|nr:hypothetical protein [Actinomycetota bacterium]
MDATSDPRARGRRPGDRLVAAGVVVFAAGLVAALVTVAPLLLGTEPMPTAVYVLSMLAPAGLGLALAGLVRQARATRRR